MTSLHRSLTPFLVAAFVVVELSGNHVQLSAQEKQNDSAEDQRAETLEQCKFVEKSATDLYRAGKYLQAAEGFEKLLSLESELYSADSIDVSNTYGWLADCYQALEEWDKSIEMRQKKLDIRTQVHGREHWRVTTIRLELDQTRIFKRIAPEQREQLTEADSKYSQAIEFLTDAKFDQAQALLLEVKATREKILGEVHYATTQAAGKLAELYQAKGDYAAAEPLMLTVIKNRRTVFGEVHPVTPYTLEKAASLYKSLGNDARFEELSAQAEEIREKLAALEGASDQSNDVQKLAKRDQLWQEAYQLSHAGKLQEAYDLGAKAFKLQLEVHGANHKETASMLYVLAERQAKLDDFEAAIAGLNAALRIQTELFEAGHRNINSTKVRIEYVQLLSKLTPEQRVALNQTESDQQKLEKLNADGKYSESIVLAKSILKTQREILPADHFQVAVSLNNLALSLENNGEFDRALPLYREAILIDEKTFGSGSPEVANQLGNLAGLYEKLGEYAKAETTYLAANDAWEQLGGKGTPMYADVLNNLALLYKTLGNYSRAEPLLLESKSISEQWEGKESQGYAVVLNNLAGLYEMMGDYARAQPLYLEALAIRERVLGKDHPDYADSLHSIAYLYESMRDFARAEPFYVEAKIIREKVYGKEHSEYATSVGNLAGLYRAMKDYDRAEPLYLESMAIREKIHGKQHIDYATCLNNLGLLYRNKKDNARAESFYLEAISIYENVLGNEHPDYATVLGNLAGLHFSIGHYEKALSLYGDVLAIREKTLGKDHPDFAISLSDVAYAHHAMGNFDKAKDLYLAALDITAKHSEMTSLILSERAQLVLETRRRYQLDRFLSLAVNSSNDSTQLTERAFSELLSRKGAVLVRQMWISKLAANDEASPLLDEYQQAVMQLATLSRIANSNQSDSWKENRKISREKVERLEEQLSRNRIFHEAMTPVALKELRAAIPQDGVLVDFIGYHRFIPSNQADKNSRGEIQLSLLAFVLWRDQPLQMIDLGQAADISELIDTWRQGFGMTAQSKAAGKELRSRLWNPLEEHLAGSDLILLSSDGNLGRLPFGALPGRVDGTYLIEDHRLTTIAVPQLLPLLVENSNQPQNSKNLLVMGDVDYDSGKLSEKPTPQLLADSQAPSYSPIKTFQLRGDMQFSRLPATADEIAEVQKTFLRLSDLTREDIQVLENENASEKAFREHASESSYLHLATHGFFSLPPESTVDPAEDVSSDVQSDAFNPDLLSGLVFSGANRDPELNQDDGILTAKEITTLSLENVELVVMSACETGLGRIEASEGLRGLQRAFQIAGAKSTIASFWNVEDRATMVLMTRFYKNLWEKRMSKLDALREAQIWMLHNPDKIWDEGTYAALRGDARRRPVTDQSTDGQNKQQRLSPEFWAAFSLSGDWR